MPTLTAQRSGASVFWCAFPTWAAKLLAPKSSPALARLLAPRRPSGAEDDGFSGNERKTTRQNLCQKADSLWSLLVDRNQRSGFRAAGLDGGGVPGERRTHDSPSGRFGNQALHHRHG